MNTLTAVDLFCGAGGFSTGFYQACEATGKRARLIGVNHWPVAVETHAANHPDAELYCESLDSIDPRKIVRGKLDILIASPECTHHSIARGGKPINDQSRASAWHVLRWAEALQPRAVVIENVREFQKWGPLRCDGKPMCRRKGETFLAFIQALRSIGYTVDHRVLNAANYGDATTRERLFIIATRGHTRPVWPDPTHAKNPSMFNELPWRPAREVIDWSIRGASINNRKKPPADKTLARIEIGIRKYWGDWAEPFLVVLRGTSSTRSVNMPMPTITAGGGHVGLVEPLVLGQQSGAFGRPASHPMPTIATAGGIAVIEPFMVPFYGERAGQTARTHDVDEPVPTIPASAAKFGLVKPFLVQSEHDRRTHRTSNPMPTITASSRGFGVIEPFVVEYYGNGDARSIREPLATVTTRDRFALVEAGMLDITFRMLQPHELAAAMSFPTWYKFAGTKTDAVRQIGNAVPIKNAMALLSQVIN